MHAYTPPKATIGVPLEANRALWGILSGAALGGLAGGLFAGTRHKQARYELLNYVGSGALVGAGVMGAWTLIRRALAYGA